MLLFKKSALLLIGLMLTVSVFAGGGSTGGGGLGTPTSPAPNCAVNPAAGNTCQTATPICDLNGYCGSTSASYTADYWSQLNSAFCGSIENNSFLIFTASATSMTFNVWLTSTQTGSGIQIMVFSSSGYCSGSITSYVCWSPGTATAGPTAVTATGLTPGNNYYIMIDGFAGDVCDYIIGIQSGAMLPVNVASSIAGGQTICLGESATLTAGGGNGTYTWDSAPGLTTLTGAVVSVTPPSEGTFNYTVHSASGSTLCPSTNQAVATVQVINCVCSITATNSGNICPGGNANLTATNVPDASSYSWSGPNGFTATSQNVLSISPPTAPGTYDYVVTATVPGGTCASTTTIEVYAPPTVHVPNDTLVCNSGTIPATVFTSTPTGATYTWTNSDASIGAAASGTGNIPSFTATNSGTAPLTSTISVTPTLNGCVGTPSSYAITVAPTPVMDPVQNITQCHGSTVNALAFNSALTGITYAWTNSNTAIGLAASGSGNAPSFTATNTTTSPATATITVTPSIGGCSGAPVTFTITVNPLPAVGAGTAQTVCAGTQVTLNGSGASTYTWNNSVTNGIAFAPTATATYTVTGTDANNCQNTAQVVVTVNPLPAVDAGADQVICVGPAVTLTATGAQTYSWNNSVTNGVAFTPTSTATYTVTGTDANGCVNTDQVIVTVNPLPAIGAGADQSICEGTSVTLSGTGGVSYVWTNGVVNGQSFTPSIGNNTYSVTGTDANGCVNTDQVVINVVIPPAPGLVADVYQGYPVLTVNFTNTSTNATGYLWEFGDGTTVPAPNNGGKTHSYSAPGTYEVILTASNGICNDTVHTTIVVLPFPPPELFIPNVFTPNGDNANEEFWIDVKFGATISVLIFNRWGNLMYEMNDFSDRWNGKINGTDVSDGVYFFKYHITGIDGSVRDGHGNVTLER